MNSPTVVDQLVQVYADSIFAKVSALKSLRLTGNLRSRVKVSITHDIRDCAWFLCTQQRKIEASEAAIRKAKRLGIDLFQQTWATQSKFDPGRLVFQWEHVQTIYEIQCECENASDVESLLQILTTRPRIAWILKSEDKELTRHGFRKTRPNPDLAYREAKIVLVGQDPSNK